MASVTVKKLPPGASLAHDRKGNRLPRKTTRPSKYTRPAWIYDNKVGRKVVFLTADDVGTYDPDDGET